MSPRILRSKSVHPSPVRQARLRLECLEDRSLLNADPLSPQHLLITTSDGTIQSVAVDNGMSVEDALVLYQGKDDVLSAEIDHVVSVSVIPNDTSFSNLWALNNTGQTGGTPDADIDAVEAWDVTTGSLSTVVAVIDSGVDYRHRDLYLNIWLNQGEIPSTLGVVDTNSDGIITFHDLNHSSNASRVSDVNGTGYIDAGDLLNDPRWENGVDNDGNGRIDDLIGWDFYSNDNDPFDDNSHGTHVAGTIGALGNNSLGVVGVNWNVQIAALKFLGANGSGSTSGAINSLNYVVGKGIKISNNSWGGGGFSSTMATAISNARNAGHIFVAAAGNNNSNNDSVANYPSNYNYDNVLAVASTDHRDQRSSFSNYGVTQVDLAAPGSSIRSTVPNNGYATYSGTSMATPHVAGAIALLWSHEPGLSYSAVISRIKGSVDVLPSLSGLVATSGRLNVAQALGSSVGDSQGPRIVSGSTNGSSSVSRVQVTFSESINASTFTTADVKLYSPSGSLITISGVNVVSGTNNTVFDITFATQTTPGTYRIEIGPDIRDTSGNQMDQNNDGQLGDGFVGTFNITSAPPTQTFSNNNAVSIRDFTTSVSSITIGQNISIEDLNVKLDITHTYNADLLIYLIGPDGTRVDLVRYRGGSANNFTGTTLDEEAGTFIGNGAAPFSGSYRPEQSLSAFDGKSATGTWRLYVFDGGYRDTGRLNYWSLIVTGSQSGSGSSASFADESSDEVAAPSPMNTPVGVIPESPATSAPRLEMLFGGDAGLLNMLPPSRVIETLELALPSVQTPMMGTTSSLISLSLLQEEGDEEVDVVLEDSPVLSEVSEENLFETSTDDALRLREVAAGAASESTPEVVTDGEAATDDASLAASGEE